MIKYIKWICLIIAIIGIIILGIIFANSNSNKNKKTEFKVEELYKTAWNKQGISIYIDGELDSEILDLKDNHYIIFKDDTHVEYHDPTTNKIDIYDYTYKDGTIIINTEENFLSKGTYNITFENEYLKLSKTVRKHTYVYYFVPLNG